jgi:hypothetical protein
MEIKNFSSIDYSLKKDEIFNLTFSETWTINLQLLNSGIISYALDWEEFWKNILPTYNTWTTSTGFLLTSWTTLKIKNLSWYSKIRIWASKNKKASINNIWWQYIYDNFKKSWKITISLQRRRKSHPIRYTTSEIEYKTNYSWTWTIISSEDTKYTHKSFFIKSWDKLTIINKNSSKTWYSDKATFIISWDYNISDLMQNNSYKIYKKTWGKEIVLEKGKIN